MNPEQIRLLFAYDAWANRRTLDACAALAPEQFTRDLHSSFPSVRDTAAHILGAYWVWLERFHGRSAPSLLKADQFPELASLRARWGEVERELHAYATGLSSQELETEFAYRDLKGNEFSNPRWQALQQLVNHGSYHRGQITTMLRQLGATAVSTDLIRFYRERQASVAS